MTKRVFFVCCLLTIVLSSCRKDVSFPVRIINQSGFDITNISFYGTVSGESISLHAGDTSETVIASYQRRVRLTPKLLSLMIEFDQGSSFSVVRNAPCFPFSKQSLDEKMNTIVITTELNGDTLIFYSALD